MFRSGGISGQIREIDFSGLGTRKFDFGFFSGFSNSLDGHFVFMDINSRLSFELFDNVLTDEGVKIFSSARCVSVSGLHFENSVGNFQNRNIECSTTQIVNSDDFSVVFV